MTGKIDIISFGIMGGLDIARGCSRNERPMNTDSSGSGRVDDIKGHPQGETRGVTKLVKPEMRREPIRSPVGVYPSWSPWRPRRAFRNRFEALQVGLEQKAKEFAKKGSEVYAKA